MTHTQNPWQRTSARHVAERYLVALSMAQAWETLGLNPRDNPSDAEINAAYRAKIRSLIQADPESVKDQVMMSPLNQAKDILLGNLRPDRGGPYVPPRRNQNKPPSPEGGWRPEDKVHKKAPDPPPVPEGAPFSSALGRAGSVTWKVGSPDGGYESKAYEDDHGWYSLTRTGYVLLGETSSHYVVAKLVRIRSHRNDDYKLSLDVYRWELEVAMPFPKTINFLKVVPKTLKEMVKSSRVRFYVIDGALTEENLIKRRGSLSLRDAILGSGLVDASEDKSLKGRKIQVEIEAFRNEDKLRAMRKEKARRNDWYLGYDWFLYLNGKKYELSASEVVNLGKSYLLMVLYKDGDYSKGKRNITRMRGGSFGLGAKDTLTQLAEKVIQSAAVKDVLLKAADQAK